MEYGSIVVLACLVVLVHGCTDLGWIQRDPNGKELDEMKVHFSEVVVFGMVKTLSSSGIPGIKQMDFEVECSYKGRVHDSIIKVTGVGNRNGQIPGCPVVRVDEGEQVVLFLKRLPQRPGGPWFQIEFAPIRGEADIFLDDLTAICGLELTTPGQVPDMCYEPLTEDCIVYKLPSKPVTTTTPQPEKKTTKAAVVVGPPVDEDSEPENDGPKDDDNSNNAYETKTTKPENNGDTAKAVSATDGDGNGSSRQTTTSLLALLACSILAAFV